MKITKKYSPVDPTKSCALSLSGVQCRDCRFGIPRYTQEQIMTAREKGDYELENEAYSCMFVAILTELQKTSKLLSKMVDK